MTDENKETKETKWLDEEYVVIDGKINEYNKIAVIEGADVIVAFTMTLGEMIEGLEGETEDEDKE